MMKITCNKAYSLLLLMFGVAVLTSCGSSKRLKYFQDMPQVQTGTEFKSVPFEEITIRPDDILNIRVNTVDVEASEAINDGNSAVPSRGIGIGGSNNINTQLVTGYLVGQDGTVELPVLGTITVAGSTLSEAKEKIREVTMKYFKEATVNVRFSNFRVSVLGDVARPGTYVVPNQQVSILDAISFSGDLTVYGKRANVMLIRKDNTGKSIAVKMDLTSKELFNSPYFYLRQNDLVYVEPSSAKIQNADTSIVRYLGLLASLVSVGILVFR